MNKSFLFFAMAAICFSSSLKSQTAGDRHPKIVNIINFIRLLEPRDSAITQDVLYQTVVKQIELMKQFHLRGTFLLQYDALMDQRYQKLLKNLPRDSFEIGAWWELPQPLVEKAGLMWRGRYAWDWRANIGFSTGYSPSEREKLADVYMKDFKIIFGYYPKSVASWFIDAHTLDYLYHKYQIIASANCKDQYGTDGYTLWGGYWNQAYYPSKTNSYMPAQYEANQIPVPVFRMLGSDPIRQYDNGLGSVRQGVVTLEPVYRTAGGDAAWVDWYFKEFVNGECMEFAYTQAGQENSFTWNAMEKGFNIQMPLIARLRDANQIQVETLAESGKWFKEHYKVTPATSVTVNHDIGGSDKKTVWFNSRFYRANLLWENHTLGFRDIHLFNEAFPSVYEKQKATSNECSFFTLPIIDGYLWSNPTKKAGLIFKTMIQGKEEMLKGGDPIITSNVPGTLQITWPLQPSSDTLVIDMNERGIHIEMKGPEMVHWLLDMAAADSIKLPFEKISPAAVSCRFEGMDYVLKASKGSFAHLENQRYFKIIPTDNKVVLNLSGSGKPVR